MEQRFSFLFQKKLNFALVSYSLYAKRLAKKLAALCHLQRSKTKPIVTLSHSFYQALLYLR